MSLSRTRRRIGLRINLAVAALVIFMPLMILAGIYWLIVAANREGVDRVLEETTAELHAYFQEHGFDSLVVEVERRAERMKGAPFYYLVTDMSRAALAGNVMEWPVDVEDREGEQILIGTHEIDGMQVDYNVEVRLIRLDEEHRLILGKDLGDLNRSEGRLLLALLLAGGLIGTAAIASALGSSTGLLRRLRGMDRTMTEILESHPEARIPIKGYADEFEALARQFNQLLDEKDELLRQARDITDDIAHDLRTPLARMRGHLEAALAATRNPERDGRTLEEVLQETNRILETFNALLNIALVESGTIRSRMEQVDLGEVVRDAVDLYEPLAATSGFTIRTEVEGATMKGDRHLLAQALTNLLDNALKYGGSGGEIVVAAWSHATEAGLSVADSGPGIAEKDRARVLKRLVRLDSERQKPGTGLGLSFVAAVARLHHAELVLEDNHPGLRVRFIQPRQA